MKLTEHLPTPEIFRRWAGITALSGAMERRLYVVTGPIRTYPHLYTLLVSPPAVGKSQAITPVEDLWKATKKFHVAPDNVTKASLIDALARANCSRLMSNGNGGQELVEYHTLLVAASEFGVFFPKHDTEFLSVINKIYDVPSSYREERRSMEGRQPDIINPQLVMLAGTQPDFLSMFMPEAAWGMGFTSRLIMVYAPAAPIIDLFGSYPEEQPELFKTLLTRLLEIREQRGRFMWAPNAQAELSAWYREGLSPKPTHSKLLHYTGRRILHLLKLMMVSSISRDSELIITMEDFAQAKDWLLDAENVMPDIFHAMLAKSDQETISELHFQIWKIYTSDPPLERKPVPDELPYEILRNKVPSERIDKILDICAKSGLIHHRVGGGWVPKPLPDVVRDMERKR